jgi:hypothetical protein
VRDLPDRLGDERRVLRHELMPLERPMARKRGNRSNARLGTAALRNANNSAIVELQS